MRKKIFLIHGKGERDGIGKNSGGDLDTIAANVCYGLWAEQVIPAAKGSPAVYGEDYEFDFLNYQQGLSQLAVHQGCDLYLPDFPIDALSPRLRLLRIANPHETAVRGMLAGFLGDLTAAALALRHQLPPEWKELVNELVTKSTGVLDKRSFFEIEMAAFAVFFTTQALVARAALGDAAPAIDDLFRGEGFAARRDALVSIIDNPFKSTVLAAVPQANTRLKLTLDDAARGDYGTRFRLQQGGQLFTPLVEGTAVIAGTARLLAEIGAELAPAEREGLQRIANAVHAELTAALNDLRALFTDLAENPNPDVAQRGATARDWVAEAEKFLAAIPQLVALEAETGSVKTLRAMLTEEASGRPVPGIEVHFRLRSAAGELGLPGQAGGRSVAAVTGDDGGVAVELRLPDPATPWEVWATFDDMVQLPYRGAAGPDAPEGGVTAERRGEAKAVAGGEAVEKLESDPRLDPELSTRMRCALLERDLRWLAQQDVRLVRLDDHHPYTPAIRETLERLKSEGLLEAIQLSSLPRGEDQPKEVQRCGTDLVYETFIKGTPADGDGPTLLREFAHVQDLHIREEELAIELSKLLGSKVNKVEMARGLMRCRTAEQLAKVMTTTGWGERVRQYEAALDKIIHRIDATLSQIQLLLPPEAGDYGKHLGWRAVLKPLAGLGKDDGAKHRELRRLYAENPANRVTVFTALSPFCNAKLGEPQINVASCINHLKPRHPFDYFLYHYGSFLMTTRRVNPDGFRIDLNEAVSFIGSKADGGHSEAASGRPESNPEFPTDRLGEVNDRNYQEFLLYLADRLAALTGLEVHQVAPVRVPKRREEQQRVVARLTRMMLQATVTLGGKAVVILFVLHQYPEKGEPELALPLAWDYLSSFIPFDYLFYCYAATTLVMINTGDPNGLLPLDALARRLGTYRDGGHPRAADCQPKFHPQFPVAHFKYVNPRSFLPYAGYLLERLRESFPEATIAPGVPVGPLDGTMQKVAVRLQKNLALLDLSCSDRNRKLPRLRILASLAPFTDRKLGEPELGAATAAVYLRGAGKEFAFFLYCESAFRVTFLALDPAPWLDLPAVAASLVARAAAKEDLQLHGPCLTFTPLPPPALAKVNFSAFTKYLEWLAAQLGAATGHNIQVVTRQDGR